MAKLITFETKLRGRKFAVSVDFHAQKHVTLGWYTDLEKDEKLSILCCSPQLANELSEWLGELSKWSKTDYYKWAKRKTGK